jgi:Zn-dependent membrane protease YugP
MSFMPIYYNSNYLMYMLPAFILMLAAQWYVSSAYKTWGKVATHARVTGAQAAQRLMAVAGLYDLKVEGIAGELTDNYDPRDRTLHLSQGVAYGQSVAALAITAHELGHAMQDQEDYFPLRLRSAMVPVVNIGSTLGWVFIIAGLIFNWTGLAWAGVLFFSGGLLFAMATLPVELNASKRARQLLADSGLIVDQEEMRGVNTVLNAAALTYVAALATALMQLLYYVSLVGGIGRRRD